MVYFLYSELQLKEENTILANCGKQFVPGIVTVNNRRERFTQISNTPDISRFIDTKIVASFNSIKEATYTPISKTTIKGE